MGSLPRSVQFDDELPPSARLDPTDDTEDYLRRRGGTSAITGPVQKTKPAPTHQQIREDRAETFLRSPQADAIRRLQSRLHADPTTGGYGLGPIVEGATKIAKGLKDAPGPLEVTNFRRKPNGWDIEPNPEARARAFRSGSQIIGGAMEMASPIVPAALARAPVQAGLGLAEATALQHVVPPVAEKMGASPEGAQFAGDVAGLGSLVGAGRSIVNRMRGGQLPPAPPPRPAGPTAPPEAPVMPTRAPTEPPTPPAAGAPELPVVSTTSRQKARGIVPRNPVEMEAAGIPQGEIPPPRRVRRRKKQAVPPEKPAPQGEEVIQAPVATPVERVSPDVIESAARKAEPQAGMLVTIRQLEAELPNVTPGRRNAAILQGAKEGRWSLNEASDIAGISPQERASLIPGGKRDDGTQRWYSGIALRAKQLPGEQRGSVTIPQPVQRAGEAIGEAAQQGAGKAVEFAQKAEDQLVDDLGPVRRLNDAMYQQARNFRGWIGKVLNRRQEFSDILPKRSYSEDSQALAQRVAAGDIQAGETLATQKPTLLNDMLRYMELERHLELGARIKGYQLPGGQDLASAAAEKAAMEQSLGPRRLAELQQSAGKVREFWNNMLAEARDAGVISPEDYNVITSRNQQYYPLERLEFIAESMEGASGQIPMPTGARSMRMPLNAHDILTRAVKGSTKKVADPLETTLRRIQRVQNLIERNRVNQHLIGLSTQPGYENLVIEIPPSGVKFPLRNFGQLGVFENGKLRRFAVPKPVSNAIEGLNRKEIDMVTKWASQSSGLLRAGATSLNIPFLPANLIRDAQTMALRGRYTPAEWARIEPVRDWVRGFLHSVSADLGIGQSEAFVKRYLEAGAGMSSFFATQRSLGKLRAGLLESGPQRIAREVLDPLALLRWAQSHVEMAPRLAQFERGLKKGLTDSGAAFHSRESTVDFSKAGSVGRVVNMWIPFLNARGQGNLNMMRALSTDPGRAANWFTLGLTVGLPTVATWAYNHKYYPHVLKDIAQYEKDRSTILIGSDRKDEKGRYLDIVKIPKGDTMVFSTPIEQALEATIGSNPQAIDRLLLQVASNFSPVGFARDGKFSGSALVSSAAPPIAKGFIEGVANKNFFTEREVVLTRGPYGDMTKASPENQFTAETPQMYVDAARILKDKVGIGLSPMKIQNFMRSQFGGLEQEITQPEKIAEQVLKGFIGAAGERQENQQWKIAQEVSDPKTRDQELDDTRAGMKIWKEIKEVSKTSGPSEVQSVIRRHFESGSLNEKTAKVLNNQLEREFGEDIKGSDGVVRHVILTPFERNMRNQPAVYVAQRMLDYLPTLDAEARRQTVVDWMQKGIITERVAAEANRMLSQKPPNRKE